MNETKRVERIFMATKRKFYIGCEKRDFWIYDFSIFTIFKRSSEDKNECEFDVRFVVFYLLLYSVFYFAFYVTFTVSFLLIHTILLSSSSYSSILPLSHSHFLCVTVCLPIMFHWNDVDSTLFSIGEDEKLPIF